MSKFPTKKRPVRHNEWTRKKLVIFLRELAASQNVAQSARAVGMSRQSAYTLRNRLRGTPFDLGWEVALEMGFAQLAQAVMDRALNGEEVVHYHRGEIAGTSRRYDNHLARWVLENPWKLGRMQVAREFSAHEFEALLERIEVASLGWEEGEPMIGWGARLGADPDKVREAEDHFVGKLSWYIAEARAEDAARPGRRGRR